MTATFLTQSKQALAAISVCGIHAPIRATHAYMRHSSPHYNTACTKAHFYIGRHITNKLPAFLIRIADTIAYLVEINLFKLALAGTISSICFAASVEFAPWMLAGAFFLINDIYDQYALYPYRYLEDMSVGLQEEIPKMHIRTDAIQKATSCLIPVSNNLNNNAVTLVAPGGSGKTTAVKQIAWEIEQGRIEKLKGKKVWKLSLIKLSAGAVRPGDFEMRLIHVMAAVARHFHESILFIDEVHLLTEHNGRVTPANYLKLYLDYGITIIAATTTKEYYGVKVGETTQFGMKQKDEAFCRRIEPLIELEPLNDEAYTSMLQKSFPQFSEELLQHIVAVAKVEESQYALPASAFIVMKKLLSYQIHTKLADQDVTQETVTQAMNWLKTTQKPVESNVPNQGLIALIQQIADQVGIISQRHSN